MKGKIVGGTLTITLDINCEMLSSQKLKHKYYPCENCGDIQEVPKNTASFICQRCEDGLNLDKRNACSCGNMDVNQLFWAADGEWLICKTCGFSFQPPDTTDPVLDVVGA